MIIKVKIKTVERMTAIIQSVVIHLIKTKDTLVVLSGALGTIIRNSKEKYHGRKSK